MEYLGLNKSPEQYQPIQELKADQAVLYVYRPSVLIFMAKTAVVNLNDVKLVELNGDVYTFAYLKPGTYKVSQYWTTLLTQQGAPPDELQEVTVNLKAGQKAYVEIGTALKSDGHQVQTTWNLKAVTEEEAFPKLAKDKYKGNRITTVEPERAVAGTTATGPAGPTPARNDPLYNERFERD
jgi:hypothetical protein